MNDNAAGFVNERFRILLMTDFIERLSLLQLWSFCTLTSVIGVRAKVRCARLESSKRRVAIPAQCTFATAQLDLE